MNKEQGIRDKEYNSEIVSPNARGRLYLTMTKIGTSPQACEAVSRLKHLSLFLFILLVSSCNFNAVIDTNQSIEDNQWLYANVAKADFEITDVTKPYQVNFKLRINTDYRYSNLFVLATFKDAKGRKKLRYQFKLAKEDGQWLGKGSGDLYTYSFPLLNNHRFADTGKYSIEIEQNMRDNPLVGISDVGIEVK